MWIHSETRTWHDKNIQSNMKKETVRFLLALLNLLLVQTGMKYPELMEIGKGAIITTRKTSHIAWNGKTVYHLLRSSQNEIPLRMKLKNVWR